MEVFLKGIIKLVVPNTKAGYTIGNQIIRSGTSVAANYRAACRARSHKEFIAKIGIVEEESDETLFWLEMIAESGLIQKEKLNEIIKESDELTAIFTATGRTAKERTRK